MISIRLSTLLPWFLTGYFVIGSLFLSAQSFPLVDIQQVGIGFANPVDITHAGDSALYIVEQRGTIRILNPGGLINNQAFLDIRSRVRRAASEQGLLGLAFHPNYAQNGYFYVNYTITRDSTRIARFTVNSANRAQADPNSEVILMTLYQPFDNHNGGDLAFGPDGYLYIGLGDGGSGGDPGNRAQNGLDLLGKILRLDVDQGSPYGIPANNPFVGDPDVADEVWSLGWRNPWRFSFDRQTGDMWIADVGQNAQEEVSFEPANTPGLNYGWRCREGSASFRSCNGGLTFTEPIFTYRHNQNLGRSITGGFVYRGQQHPGMNGVYVCGDFVSGNVWAVRQTTGGNFEDMYVGKFLNNNSISTFGEGADGELYVADYTRGTIHQLIDRATSIEPAVGSAGLHIFPQPATTELQLRFDEDPRYELMIEILDLQGRSLTTRAYSPSSTLMLDLRNIIPGTYLLKINCGDKFWQHKILVNP